MFSFELGGAEVCGFTPVVEGGRFEWDHSCARIAVTTHLHPGDRESFRRSPLTLGLYEADGLTVIVARWRDWMTIDMPYNAALYPAGQGPQTSLILNGTPRTRLSVPMQLIDRNTREAVAFRLITFSPQFSRRLAVAAERQMAVGMSRPTHLAAIAHAFGRFKNPDAVLGACALVERAGI